MHTGLDGTNKSCPCVRGGGEGRFDVFAPPFVLITTPLPDSLGFLVAMHQVEQRIMELARTNPWRFALIVLFEILCVTGLRIRNGTCKALDG